MTLPYWTREDQMVHSSFSEGLTVFSCKSPESCRLYPGSSALDLCSLGPVQEQMDWEQLTPYCLRAAGMGWDLLPCAMLSPVSIYTLVGRRRSNTLRTPPRLPHEHFLARKRLERVIKFLECPIFLKGYFFLSFHKY